MYSDRQRCLRDVFRDRRRLNGEVVEDKDDRLSNSLLEDDRVCYDEDGESWTVYGFRDFNNAPHEVVREYFKGMCIEINSPYDCTGEPFTLWIDFHYNPCGLVSFRHRIGLDV